MEINVITFSGDYDIIDNYSVILGRDWIQANQCVPSTLHQMFIQWVDSDVETVCVDASDCMAMGDAPVLWTYDSAKCSIEVNISNYQFISFCKKGFTHVMLEPMEN
jgi:hypothetical protein